MIALLSIIKKYWLPLTLCIFLGINVLSLYPFEALSPEPGVDKAHHFLAYAALMFPVALRKPNHWLLMAFAFALWSGCIELIQPYVNRYGEWLDMAANTGGLLFGALAALTLNYLVKTSDNNR